MGGHSYKPPKYDPRHDPDQDQDQEQDQDQKQANLQAQLQGQGQLQGQAQGQAQFAVQSLDSKSDNDNSNDNDNWNENGNWNWSDNRVDNDLDNKVDNDVDNSVDNDIHNDVCNTVDNTVETNVDVDVKVDLDLDSDSLSPVIDLSNVNNIANSLIMPDVVDQQLVGPGNLFNLDQVNNLVDNDNFGSASVSYSGCGFEMDAKAFGGDGDLSSETGDIIGERASGAITSADAVLSQDAFSQTITQGANIQFNTIEMATAGNDLTDSHDLG
ncbi:hypothetical protein ACSVBT_14545 [Afipia sp. TerB]|jgi:hypothetical protein